MEKIDLNREEIHLAHELANLYWKMDREPGSVSNEDIDRLYGVAASNKNIHYEALRINKMRHRNSKNMKLS